MYAERVVALLQERAARVAAFNEALGILGKTSGWEDLEADQRARIEAPLRAGTVMPGPGVPVPQLRSELEACEVRLKAAVVEVRRLVEGERLATVRLSGYFGSGVETEEQLDAALDVLSMTHP